MADEYVQRHRNAAATHDAASARHDHAAAFWADRGDEQRASIERRNAELERTAADLERERAALPHPTHAALDQADNEHVRPLTAAIAEQAAPRPGALAAQPDPAEPGNPGLTRAELRLLPLLATHLSVREIGEYLSVSRNTVKTQASSIYRKLGASSRSETVGRAVELGLIDGEVLRIDRTM